jgi:hypothetical protein
MTDRTKKICPPIFDLGGIKSEQFHLASDASCKNSSKIYMKRYLQYQYSKQSNTTTSNKYTSYSHIQSNTIHVFLPY